MRKLLLIVLLIFICKQHFAQFYVKSGTNITIKNSSTLYVNGNIVPEDSIASDGIIVLDGKLELESGQLFKTADDVPLEVTGSLVIKSLETFDGVTIQEHLKLNNVEFNLNTPDTIFNLNNKILVLGIIQLINGTDIYISSKTEIELEFIEYVAGTLKIGKVGTESEGQMIYGEGSIVMRNIAIANEDTINSNMGFSFRTPGSQEINNTLEIARFHNGETQITDGSIDKNFQLSYQDDSVFMEAIEFEYHSGDYPYAGYKTGSLRLFLNDTTENPYDTKFNESENNEGIKVGNSSLYSGQDGKTGYNFTLAPENCKVVPIINGIADSYLICEGNDFVLSTNSITPTANTGIYKYILDEDSKVSVVGDIHSDTLNLFEYTDSKPSIGPHNYTLTIVDPKGCYSDTTFTLTVGRLPLKPNFDVDSNICEGSYLPLEPKDTNNLLFDWYVDGKPVSDQTLDTLLFDTPGNYTIELLATSTENFCTRMSDSEVVNVSREPVFKFVAYPVCYGDSLSISILCPNKDSSYFYNTFSDFYITSSNFDTINVITDYANESGNINNLISKAIKVADYKKTGEYNAVLHWKLANGSCSGTDTIPYEINPMPQAGFTVDPVCIGEQSEFKATTNNVSILTYYWYINGIIQAAKNI